jgi:ABC-type multidrug transport system ATPase subunit
MPQENIIQINNLTKKFNKFTAVDDLSLTVNKGGIFGFLGPNGAGKSTTIRMMLTLIEPSAGSIEFFGKKVSKTERNVFSKIGALVEKPDFYLYLSAYRNLEFFGSISGADVSKKSIMKMLETVGLADRAYSKVKTYSLGMKQRLGLAQALIHNPELIILDEPTNGLDPQGMKEVKDLLIHLANNEGKTIFLSSHILREVETMATSMAIINNGKTIVQGDVNELLNASKLKVTFEFENIEAALKVISDSQWEKKKLSTLTNTISFELEQFETAILIKHLTENNIDIVSVVPIRSLEDYFLNITSGGSIA